jgi:threonine/homoserine/homoserine lactone efflux protein
VDVTYAVLTSLSLGRVLDRPAVRWGVTVAGIVLLTYLGVLSLRAAVRDWHNDPIERAKPVGSARAAYLTGVLMTLANPMTLAFWFVAVPATLGQITQEPGRDLPMICAGVFIGTLAWVVLFAGVLGVAGRVRRNWWLAAADGVGGLILLAFAAAAAGHAAVSLWRSLHPLL